MEWTRLSDLTGNATYGELAKKAESYLIDPLNPEVGEPYPGLIGSDLSIANGSFLDSQGGWTGGTDSYYEYLIKMYMYDPTRFASYKENWIQAVNSSMEYLVSHPTSRPDLTFLSYYFNGTVEGLYYYSQHRELTPYPMSLFDPLFVCLLFVCLSRLRLLRGSRFWGNPGCTALKEKRGEREEGGSPRHAI